MKENKRNIFAAFSIKAFKEKQKKKKQQAAIDYAKALGDKMVAEKQKAREDFMQKLLENAKIMNEARADWEDEEDNELSEEELNMRADEILNKINETLEDKTNG